VFTLEALLKELILRIACNTADCPCHTTDNPGPFIRLDLRLQKTKRVPIIVQAMLMDSPVQFACSHIIMMSISLFTGPHSSVDFVVQETKCDRCGGPIGRIHH
jgi:hypothetical protein